MQCKRFVGMMAVSGLIMLGAMVVRPPRASGQAGDNMAKFKKNVVHLTVTFSDDSMEQGFGFVIGEQDVGKAENVLYVATANHVVRKDSPDVTVKSIKAQFCTYKLKSFSADLLEVFDPELDFALLEIQKPFPKFELESTLFDLEPAAKSDAWFIGLNGQCLESGVVKIANVSPKGSLDLLDNQIQPGTSGAPVISNKGIVGLITRSEPTKAVAVRIGVIKKLAEDTGVPWGLQATTLPPGTAQPVPTPGVNESSQPNNRIQGLGFTFEPPTCKRTGDKIICALLITSNDKDKQVALYFEGSRIFDNFGNEFRVDQLTLGNKSSTYYNVVSLLIAEVPTKATLTFFEVPPEATIIKVLELIRCELDNDTCNDRYRVQFRDIPISE